MTSKYLSGTYTSGYTLSGVYTSVTIGTKGSIGGTGLVGSGAASYSILNLGRIAASGALDAGITLVASGTIVNGSSSDTSAYIGGAAGANKTEQNGGNGVSLAGGNVVNYGAIRGGNGGDLGNGRDGGAGGAGISLSARGNIRNSGTIMGGGGFGDGAGGAGVSLSAPGNIRNSGAITGGAGGYDVTAGAGISSAGGNIRNSGTITGGISPGYYQVGGAGIALSTKGRVVNDGAVFGGTETNHYTGVGGVGISLAGGGDVTNAGTIMGGAGYGYCTGGAGVSLSGGGTVQNSGTIMGGGGFGDGAGIVLTQRGVIVNSGAIEGSYGIMLSGGRVRNGSQTDKTAFVSGGAAGILADSSSTAPVFVENFGIIAASYGSGIALDDKSDNTVANFGKIDGPAGTSGPGAGIVLSGGRIENGSQTDKTATVSGGADGVRAGPSPTAPVFVENFGLITASYGYVRKTKVYGVGVSLDDKFNNTVVNFGTITGASGTAIAFGGGNDVLVVEPGAVFHGVVDLGGGANTIEFEKAGTIQFSIGDFGLSSTNKLVFSDRGFRLGLAGATQTPKPLPPSLFIADSSGKFTTTTQRFAYDTSDGRLFYDAHGSGSPASRELAVTLDNHPHLVAGDLFFVS